MMFGLGELNMKEFIDYAFYGGIPNCFTSEQVYTWYCIWCKQFGYVPIMKLDFIEAWANIDKRRL